MFGSSSKTQFVPILQLPNPSIDDWDGIDSEQTHYFPLDSSSDYFFSDEE